MRIYDPRIGRFLSVDPLTSKYPYYTPYQFSGNMPIWATDLDGLEPNKTTGNIQSNISVTSSDDQISNSQTQTIKPAIIQRLNGISGSYYNGTTNIMVTTSINDVSGTNAPASTTWNNRQNGTAWTFGINLISGSGVSDANYNSGTMNLFIGDPNHPNIDAVTHEYMHLLGLSDRYAFFNHSKNGPNGPFGRILTKNGEYMAGTTQKSPGNEFIPVSISPLIDPGYYGKETKNTMFGGESNTNRGITQYQWDIIFNNRMEPNWGGNNVYLGNTGVFHARMPLSINNAGEIGTWMNTKGEGIHFKVLPNFTGWYNDVTGQGNQVGKNTMALPQNSNFVPPLGSIRSN